MKDSKRILKEHLRVAGTEIRDLREIVNDRNAEMRRLKDELTSARATADESMNLLCESEGTIAHLLAIIEDPILYERVRAVLGAQRHHRHVRECREGACEDIARHIAPGAEPPRP